MQKIAAFFDRLVGSKGPSGRWHPHHVTWFGKVLVTGEKARGVLMRTKGPDGRWQYRRPTADEMSDYLADEAW